MLAPKEAVIDRKLETLDTDWSKYCAVSIKEIIHRICDKIGDWKLVNHNSSRDNFSIEGSITKKIIDDDDIFIDIQRTVNFDLKTITHDALLIKPGQRGYGRTIMRNSFPIYKQYGFNVITVNAALDDGPYVWARFGFVPTEASWESLRETVSARLEKHKEEIEDALPGMYSAIIEDLNDPSPKSIWLLVDKKHKIGNQSLGVMLLHGIRWDGIFSFDDPEAVERFESYVGVTL